MGLEDVVGTVNDKERVKKILTLFHKDPYEFVLTKRGEINYSNKRAEIPVYTEQVPTDKSGKVDYEKLFEKFKEGYSLNIFFDGEKRGDLISMHYNNTTQRIILKLNNTFINFLEEKEPLVKEDMNNLKGLYISDLLTVLIKYIQEKKGRTN